MKDSTTLLTTREAAEILKCSESKLEKDRFYDKGLPYVKDGRTVRYNSNDIVSHIQSHTIRPGNNGNAD